VTLRLLETGGRRLEIGDLGMSPADRAVFDGVLRRPYGLVLLTGPTGAGKTTTLYAAIAEILRCGPRNVITVEDPVEYEIPGVAQAEVDSADKVNFAKALKSILRHDPDVVMIGEIRDRDSLDAAVKASLTGHLVLSTLHANTARASETRLTDLGLDPSLVPSVLRMAVAQRLVRRLCPACRERGEDGAYIMKTLDPTDPYYFNSLNNIDYTMTCNGLYLGEATDASRALNYSSVPAEIVVGAHDAAIANGRTAKHYNVGDIVAETDVGTSLTAKRDALLTQAVSAPVDQFDAVYDAGMADYLASGGQAIIDERAEKLQAVYGEAPATK